MSEYQFNRPSGILHAYRGLPTGVKRPTDTGTGKRKREKRRTDFPKVCFADTSEEEGEKDGDECKLPAQLSPILHPEHPTGNKRRDRPRGNPDTKVVEECINNADNEFLALEQPPPPLDPEHSLDGRNHPTAPATVHWDPQSVDGKKIGWRIRVELDNNTWADGRIVRYDPYSHKHKIRLQHNGQTRHVWIWIRNDQHNVYMATRMVWAHVKGHAWWPAMVMETNSYDPSQKLQVEFFGTGRVSTVRDSSNFIRPFLPCQPGLIVPEHKYDTYKLACEEFDNIQKTRNEAALFYAEKSLHLCDQKAPLQIVGRRVQIFRDDVNFPYGDTVVGKVRKYSGFQKKYLVSFEVSEKTHSKYDATWLSLTSRNTKLLGKRNAHAEVSPEALVPFLVGYQADESDDYHKLLNDHCRGCVEGWTKTDTLRVVCDHCNSSYHLGCFDPPLQQEQYQELIKDGVPLLCPQCTTCRGCYQKDSTFGSYQLSSMPTNVCFPANEALNVCLPCSEAYEEKRYCPNCAHTWDEHRYNEVQHQHDWYGSRKGRKEKSELVEDTEFPLVMGAFSGDDKIPHGLKVQPSSYYPETTKFGMAESQMVECDSCQTWVHAGCADVTEDEYKQISDGDHIIFGKEFLCRVCCRKRCHDIIQALKEEDRTMYFAQPVPVSESDAAIYHDLISRPMDLKTLTERAKVDEYQSYAWTRELFELMVLNALTSNHFGSGVWEEAKRFYYAGLENVFRKIGKAALPGQYDEEIQKLLKEDENARRQEADRVQVDHSVEDKDFVAANALRQGPSRGASPVTGTLDAEKPEEHIGDKENCPPSHPSEAAVSLKPFKSTPRKKNINDGKHTEHIPPKSQPEETLQSTTVSLPSLTVDLPPLRTLVPVKSPESNLLPKTPVEEHDEKGSSKEESYGPLDQPSKVGNSSGKSTSIDGKHTEHIPPKSQPEETLQSTTVSLPSLTVDLPPLRTLVPVKSPELNLLPKTPVEEQDEKGSPKEESYGPLDQPSKVGNSSGKSTSIDGKHAERIPPKSQPEETLQSTIVPLPSVRPMPSYKQNVVGRMIWLRPNSGERFWIRGRVEKCERVIVDEVGENGNVSSSESVYHVIRCTDDGTLYRVQLQQTDQLQNLVWM